MNQMPIKIGNAAGFWGDDIDAPKNLLEAQPDLDYLTLDYLAEVSMSIMAIQREKDPTRGYASDFLTVLISLIPAWKKGSKCKVVTNAGGLNPLGLAELCRQELLKANLPLKIAIVQGDDVLKELKATPSHALFNHLEKNQALTSMISEVVTANAYVGAQPIAQALKDGADIIITGRIADPSLTVGPCLFHFGWKEDAYQEIAGATVAGHLIECGTQITGGISNEWLNLPDLDHIGFPIAEVAQDGSCIITKPLGTGGAVTERTVKEQLLYEISDPACYRSPDVTLSLLELSVREIGKNRVEVKGALGSPPSAHYKVSATYRAGYKAEGFLTFVGEKAQEKAKRAGEVIISKVKQAGYELHQHLIEVIGNDLECVLHIAVRDHNKLAVDRFTKAIAPLVTSGPAGTTGYTAGRPDVRPVFGFWPCLIERTSVTPTIEIL